MRSGQRGHVGSHLPVSEISLVARFSDLRHVEMGKAVGQDCHTVVKCILCFLAFNNLVTWNFTIFFNSQTVEAKTPQVEREDSTKKTSVSPNLNVNSGNSSRLPSERLETSSERTGSVNKSSLGSFFTSYMVTTLLFPTVLVFSLNATLGHLQPTAPRLFASRAIAVLLCVVQLVLLTVQI